jgi:hypothetical protein
MDFLKPYTAQLLSVLLIMSGLLVLQHLQHGMTKYLNYPAGPMNNASPMTMSGAAGLLRGTPLKRSICHPECVGLEELQRKLLRQHDVTYGK